MSSQKDLHKVYLARAGGSGEDEEFALENGVAIIGFREIPSMEGMRDYEEVAKLVAARLLGRKPRAIGNIAGQLWAFAIAMTEGDIVVLPRKLTSQIALGRVKGPYRFLKVGNEFRHTRTVEWVRPDAPRTAFEQDMLYSFGAFLTVCNVSRNDAERRVAAVLAGKSDPGPSTEPNRPTSPASVPNEAQTVATPDLPQLAHDQVLAHIQARFAGHALAGLVDAVLRADGWVTKVSPPGPDGGVDILAGRGPLGLDAPRLCVQVKSQNSPADVTVYRTLQGTMQTFKAEQGLLVCWGGFNRSVLAESKQGHFTVRLWESRDLVEAIYRNYEHLPAEIQAELPLKRVWMLVVEGLEE
jgi:restriction system protein